MACSALIRIAWSFPRLTSVEGAYGMEGWLQFSMKTWETWETTDIGRGRLGIQCPSTSCRGKAVVNKRKWIGGNSYKTRSCTYCFKTFLIPPKLMEIKSKMEKIKIK